MVKPAQVFEYGAKEVSANTDTTILSYTIPTTGCWLICSYMDSNAHNTGTYNHTVNCNAVSLTKTVRTSMTNGGGSSYAGIYNFTAGQQILIKGYSPIACTLRVTLTATRLA